MMTKNISNYVFLSDPLCVEVVQIEHIEGGQKDALLRRAKHKKMNQRKHTPLYEKGTK